MSTLDTGRGDRLGAHWDGSGVEFAVFSRHAERIELCLFDEAGDRETARLELPGRRGDVFHGRLPDAGPGLVYGLRAHGPYAPRDGHRFNPNKLLLDPMARELVGAFRWHDTVYGWTPGHRDGCDSFDARDSAAFVPKARVVAPLRMPRDLAAAPRRPWGETVLYELHVRGFTIRHPQVPAAIRGTVEGLAHPAAIAHLRALGVTAVELLPVAAWLDELHLVRADRRNYWGYNPIAFCAMQPALAGPRGAAAMAGAVDALHDAGIEVILDVVFNHTGEGDERGPTLSLRGLDNATYYRADPHRPGRYANLSGCGNTLAAHDPAVGALIVDSLRYWADEVGVDGFRFDLASAITRDARGAFDTDLPWLRAVRDDPVLSRCKLVAEAWDCDGRFVGGFPAGWSEWNDRARDDLRRFWRGDRHAVAPLATRLGGSSDLFGARGPTASVNFLTAHDGFTLADLVSYRSKRNAANGEDGRDGSDANWSDDCGADGPATDPEVLRRRRRRMRAMLATLMLSRGVPMLRAGDEFAVSQGGNNNPYGHDGPLTWITWPAGDATGAVPSPAPDDLRGLLTTLARLRDTLPCLRAEQFFTGRTSDDTERLPDVTWLREDALAMTDADWHDPARHTLAMLVDAGRARPGAPRDRAWIAFVASDTRRTLRLPPSPHRSGWVRVLDTAADAVALAPEAGGAITVEGPAVVVCLTGDAARHERDRWQAGAEAACFVAAGDPYGEVECVLRAGTSTLELRVGDGPPSTGHRLVPGTDTRVVAEAIADGRRLQRHRFRVPAALPLGATPFALHAPESHRAVAGAPACRATVFATPARCWQPPALQHRAGAWLVSVQVPALHSTTSWGIGDFDDLARLARRAAAVGAAGLLVSPVHAPSFGWPERASPYAPSSRVALNPLYLSLPRAASGFPTPLYDDWLGRAETGAMLRSVRAAAMVDHRAVLALKRQALDRLWSDFRAGRDTARARDAHRDFEQWRTTDGLRVAAHVCYEALAEHHGVADAAAWPAGHEHPDTPAVAAFRRAHADRIAFHAFVQWLAARQWRAAGDAAREAGAAIGLVADLAVGADPAGADAWTRPAGVATDHEIGAPPDAFAPQGQAWGLPPWRPDALAAAGYAPFDALLAATMDGAGGLRVDHVMALERLFWVPRGAPPSAGAYVRYPLEDLLRLVAMRSALHRCLVIGEDLGTVRPGFRERMARAGVLSTRVAWFERDAHGRLADPRSLPALAAVCASTHDLPTIDGWAAGIDLDERARVLGIDDATLAHQRADRAADLARVVAGLDAHHIAGADLVERMHRWLAASGARLAIVQLEDVCGQQRQVNLPGTPDVPPNWRQRLPLSIEALVDAPRWRALESIFAGRRTAPPR